MLNKSLKRIIPKNIIPLGQYIYNKIASLTLYVTKKSKLHRYAGVPLYIYIFDQVSKNWYDHNWQRDEIEFLRKNNLKKGATVFNIGAHHGVVALIFSKIVGKHGMVIGVDMDPKHIQVANINKNVNNASNLKFVQAAIAESNGQVAFAHDSIVNTPSINGSLLTESITIDDLTIKYGRPSIIYIDIEGYEYNALQGATKTIKYYPNFCIEVHVKHGLENYNGSVRKIISYFPKTKYNLYIAPASENCIFKPFSFSSKVINDRFYLIAVHHLSTSRR